MLSSSIPKLSVVTSVFNAQEFLEESLNSVFSQDFEDFEIIIVNDGSTDQTQEIINKFKTESRLVLLNNKYNEGVPYSRNRAFLAAKGEYIAIHDADDISLPQRFEKQVNYLDAHPYITVVGSHAYRIGQNGEFMGYMSYPPEDTQNAFRVIRQFKLNPIIDPSSAFRRAPILDVGGYRMEPEIATAQDFDLWCRLLVNGYQIYNFQEPLIKYRINPHGVTRIKKQEQILATDLVWGSFQKRSFPAVKLRPECFKEENTLDFLN